MVLRPDGGAVCELSYPPPLASARPGGDATMFALHLALALREAQPKHDILLLDLGVPAGDSLQYLGIDPSYTFMDAIRSLRRLDDTLINTAFPKHDSGLRILAMPEDALDAGRITSADLYVLVNVLKRHFHQIVVNLGGVPASEFLYVLLGRADRWDQKPHVPLVDQGVRCPRPCGRPCSCKALEADRAVC